MPQWLPIGSIIGEFPGETPPPVPDDAITRITELKITHPNDFPTTVLKMPAKGIYEPPATLKQKDLLMKLGCNKPELLRLCGRKQATFMIDEFFKDKDAAIEFELEKRAHERQVRSKAMLKETLRMLPIVLIGIALGVLAYYLLM